MNVSNPKAGQLSGKLAAERKAGNGPEAGNERLMVGCFYYSAERMLIEWKGCGAVELISSEKQREGNCKERACRMSLGLGQGTDAFYWKEILSYHNAALIINGKTVLVDAPKQLRRQDRVQHHYACM